MDTPEVRKALDEFYPRIIIRMDNIISGRVESDQKEVFNLCVEALKKKYSIVVNYTKETISIGKNIS